MILSFYVCFSRQQCLVLSRPHRVHWYFWATVFDSGRDDCAVVAVVLLDYGLLSCTLLNRGLHDDVRFHHCMSISVFLKSSRMLDHGRLEFGFYGDIVVVNNEA